MPIQQMLLGSGSSVDRIYVDDIFSTYVWKGTGGNQTHNNGLDLSTEGGLVWIKARTALASVLTDTVRGTTKQLQTEGNSGELTSSARLTAFNTNGFTTGSEELVGQNNTDFASWSFRKTEKFFDIQTWNGNLTSGRTISHNLGCIPGLVIVKRNNGYANWAIYHRDLGTDKVLFLNTNAAETQSNAYWNNTLPTNSVITLGNNTNVNGGSGDSYVAYIFGGGESTAATARSVDFDGSDVCWSDSSDNTLGTSDFTLEYWFKADNNPSSGNDSYIVDQNNNYWSTRIQSDGTHQYLSGASARITSTTSLGEGQWHHIAIVRSSGTSRMYVNGVPEGGTYSDSTDYDFTLFYMGRRENGTNTFDGKISNLRLVVGTAVYTSSFRPPTEPLTNITNTKLLALNNSSVTGTTVGTIAVSGNTGLLPTASTDSPFDDPENYTFGAKGDTNVIKTGSYTGNGSTDGPHVYLGWQPSMILLKRAQDTASWAMFDSIRGIVANGDDPVLQPDVPDAEYTTTQYLDVTATGFTLKGSFAQSNASGNKYIYVAFRMSDGYVGKPPSAGTDVFAMDYSNGSSFPNFDSNFVVDYWLARNPTSADPMTTHGRLTGNKYMRTTTTGSESSSSLVKHDSNVGVGVSFGSDYLAWMWKRHAGFDVVAYTGAADTSGDVEIQHVQHSLGKTPEMMWVKRRDSGLGTPNWFVYHKGMNGGSSPQNYHMYLNTSGSEGADAGVWKNTAPTATQFTVGGAYAVNQEDKEFIALLFASVDGISKVGSYTGSDSDQTITLGFQPRFLIVKAYNQAYSWLQLDTTRGWATSSGNNSKYLFLELDWVQNDIDVGYLTSTGFVAKGNSGNINDNGASYIYYAHA